MWILLALGSAFFAGVTSILAKIGIKNTDSNLATALRTIIVVVFAWIMVFIKGSQSTISSISTKSLFFLILSGISTGASWLCYFRALQIGDINKVIPIDKSSTVLSMILAFILFRESFSFMKLVSMILIMVGTYMMIEFKKVDNQEINNNWIIFAVLSALFASLTSIFGKIGIEDVESNLGIAIRTVVVIVMAFSIVFSQGKHREIKLIDTRSWIFIALSGLSTGLSWMCYYHALKDGSASVVVPIDKLSILVTITFGYFVFHEKLKKMQTTGLLLIITGTLCLLI